MHGDMTHYYIMKISRYSEASESSLVFYKTRLW